MTPPQQPDMETQIQQALDALATNKYPSITRAATAYAVAATTLRRRLKGGKTRKEGQETAQCLTKLEEDELERWIVELTERNIPARVGMLNGMAATILAARQPPSTKLSVGVRWYQGFLHRHSTLVSKFSRALDHARSVAITKPLIKSWLELFSSTIRQYKITAENTYNMDETGIAMGVLGRSMVVVPRTAAQRYMQMPGNKNWVSILKTINDTGNSIDPFLIFKGKNHQSSWYPRAAPRGWKFAILENGWTNDELGLAWLKQHFDPLTQPSDSVTYRLLVLDGHSSHKTWEFLEFCQSHRIVVLCLPAHTTHQLQPLDIGCFQSLKAYYQRKVEEDSRRGVINIDKHQFIELYQQVRALTFDERHIKQAWFDTGLIPLSPQHLYARIPELTGRVIPSSSLIPLPSQSSSPLPSLTPSPRLKTPTTLNELQHYHQRYQNFYSFSLIDSAPSCQRYDKIYQAASRAITACSIAKRRYEQLQETTAQNSYQRRKRQQIRHVGLVLTTETLERMDQTRWEEGEVTSSEVGEEEDSIGTLAFQVFSFNPEDRSHDVSSRKEKDCQIYFYQRVCNTSSRGGQGQRRGRRRV